MHRGLTEVSCSSSHFPIFFIDTFINHNLIDLIKIVCRELLPLYACLFTRTHTVYGFFLSGSHEYNLRKPYFFWKVEYSGWCFISNVFLLDWYATKKNYDSLTQRILKYLTCILFNLSCIIILLQVTVFFLFVISGHPNTAEVA